MGGFLGNVSHIFAVWTVIGFLCTCEVGEVYQAGSGTPIANKIWGNSPDCPCRVSARYCLPMARLAERSQVFLTWYSWRFIGERVQGPCPSPGSSLAPKPWSGRDPGRGDVALHLVWVLQCGFIKALIAGRKNGSFEMKGCPCWLQRGLNLTLWLQWGSNSWLELSTWWFRIGTFLSLFETGNN